MGLSFNVHYVYQFCQIDKTELPIRIQNAAKCSLVVLCQTGHFVGDSP
jgi:hypothetical protein